MSLSALVELTCGCDMDCVFCRRNAGRPSGIPAEPDWLGLDAFLEAARRLGAAGVDIGGDEPSMLGPEALLRLARACRDAGPAPTRLQTNGLRLAREGLLDRLLEAGVGLFALPLYGPDAPSHDAVTRAPGSFEAVRSSARRLGGRAVLHAVVLRQNQAQLGRMRELAAEWGCELEAWELVRLSPHADYADLEPTPGAGASVSARREADVELLYNPIVRQLRWRPRRPGALEALLSGPLGGRLRPLPEAWSEMPAFRDPARFLRLLGLCAGEGDGFELEVLSAASAAEALRLGLGELRRGRRSGAALAFRQACEFPSDDANSRRAKGLAAQALREVS